MRTALKFSAWACVAISLAAAVTSAQGQGDKPEDDALAGDLKLLQGKWELLHGNEGKGPPTVRSVKEIVGNRETLRRYDIASGKMLREHSVDFTISTSGSVRVFTFYTVGGDPKKGQSFVYKVDANNFYDIPGLLHGNEYRNYQDSPTIWHWRKVKEAKKEARAAAERRSAEPKSE